MYLSSFTTQNSIFFSFICIASTIYIPKLNSQDEPKTNITEGEMVQFYNWIEFGGVFDDMTWL